MPDDLILTPEESEVINGFVADGPSTINDDNVDELTFALLKTSAQTFNKAMTILSTEAKLRKDIVEQISKTAASAIVSADATTNKIIDNDRANSDAIREMLKTAGDDPEKFRMCITELRSYSQNMTKANQESQAFQKHVIDQQKETVDSVKPKSSVGRDAALIIGGAAIGSFLGWLFKIIFGGNNNNNNNPPQPPVSGSIR